MLTGPGLIIFRIYQSSILNDDSLVALIRNRNNTHMMPNDDNTTASATSEAGVTELAIRDKLSSNVFVQYKHFGR